MKVYELCGLPYYVKVLVLAESPEQAAALFREKIRGSNDPAMPNDPGSVTTEKVRVFAEPGEVHTINLC